MGIRERVAGLTAKVYEKLSYTAEADNLLFEIDGKQPNVKLMNQSAMLGDASTPAGFIYPNTIVVGVLAFNSDATDPVFEEDPTVEGAYALSQIHELCHRRQSIQEGVQAFFKATLSPEQQMHAEILMEAENYARTAQIAWRLAHDADEPYEEVKDYMLAASKERHTESSYAVYAEYMKDKEITPENELAAMRAAVSDFLFDSHNAQRYVQSRVNQIHTFLESGKLQQQFAGMAANDARAWMKQQPTLAGIGPDYETYDVQSLIALGSETDGSIFEVQEGFTEKIGNPASVFVFLSETDAQKLVQIMAQTNAIREHITQTTTGSAAQMKVT